LLLKINLIHCLFHNFSAVGEDNFVTSVVVKLVFGGSKFIFACVIVIKKREYWCLTEVLNTSVFCEENYNLADFF
jgi:hypothetical protein